MVPKKAFSFSCDAKLTGAGTEWVNDLINKCNKEIEKQYQDLIKEYGKDNVKRVDDKEIGTYFIVPKKN